MYFILKSVLILNIKSQIKHIIYFLHLELSALAIICNVSYMNLIKLTLFFNLLLIYIILIENSALSTNLDLFRSELILLVIVTIIVYFKSFNLV